MPPLSNVLLAVVLLLAAFVAYGIHTKRLDCVMHIGQAKTDVCSDTKYSVDPIG